MKNIVSYVLLLIGLIPTELYSQNGITYLLNDFNYSNQIIKSNQKAFFSASFGIFGGPNDPGLYVTKIQIGVSGGLVPFVSNLIITSDNGPIAGPISKLLTINDFPLGKFNITDGTEAFSFIYADYHVNISDSTLYGQSITYSANIFYLNEKNDTISSGWLPLQTVYWKDDLHHSAITPVNSKDELINVYPNPCSNKLRISGFQTIKNVSIYDVLGKEIIQFRNLSSNEEINTSALNKGVYFVKIFDDSGSRPYIQKIVKQ